MEFSSDVWANHRKGEATRMEILYLISLSEGIGKREISRQMSLCDRQVYRQLSTLVQEGKVKRVGNMYFTVR